MPSSPLLIGITGGIGSGKTTVCKIFEILGGKVYYSDEKAKWLMGHNERLRAEIIEIFGDLAYNQQGLNSKWMAERVFHDHHLLQELNSKVHPAVRRNLKEWIAENSDQPILFNEAALLFETGSFRELDKTILVTASEKIRIERVLARDPHRSHSDVQAIIEKQMKDQEKIALANFVIDNSGTISLIKQAIYIYRQLA